MICIFRAFSNSVASFASAPLYASSFLDSIPSFGAAFAFLIASFPRVS
jgi:hypothetical protein